MADVANYPREVWFEAIWVILGIAAFFALVFAACFFLNRLSVAAQKAWQATHADEPEPRGFEVKRTTGYPAGASVLKEKDDDHG